MFLFCSIQTFLVAAVHEHMCSTAVSTYTQSNTATPHLGVHTEWLLLHKWLPRTWHQVWMCPLGQLIPETCLGMLCFFSRVQENPSASMSERENYNFKRTAR